MYDYDFYANDDRGLYFKKDDIVCGEVAETEQQMIDAIRKNIDNPHLFEQLRKKRMETYMQYESSQACDMILKRIKEEIKEKIKN